MTDWNQADPPETLRLWLNTDPLTLFQAVMLALGRDPSLTSTGRPKAYGAMEQALRQAIRRSEVLGIKTLPNPGDWPSTRDVYSTGDEHEIYVHQIAMRQWLRKMEYEKAFFFLCHPKDWPGTAAPALEPAAPVAVAAKPDKPIREDGRENLLRVIRALHALAEVKQRGGAGQVERKLVALGFRKADKTPNPGHTTVAAILKEAADLCPDYEST
ncbi:MAG: hypothetical protein JSS41_05280 [Proteobacteria bacterium]|nr:hypothetical protein [Pseudomonadota bacterium]